MERGWTKREKLATLFQIMADGFPHPNELSESTRVLIGLPRNLPSWGYSSWDTRIGVVETLAEVLGGK